ncbi:MAG TPA: APC family permease [Candidatus Krumholzibacteria bacterium]|nr:APC family permease [Candidatus Krumholzibacteria bacterium]
MREESQLIRAIGRWTLVALVLNSIIGSGIFGLPAVVAGKLGTASIWAYLVAAAGIAVIVACFAEVGSQFRQAGGPYLYARAAFGRFVGIQVGWLAWLVRLTSAAANANLFVLYLAEFWPRAEQPLERAGVLSLLLGGLTLANVRGVRTGTRLSSVFAIAKLLPLVLFIVAGLVFQHTRAAPNTVPAGTGGWLEALLLLVFAYGGFEAALLPMGEARNPRRDAPIALFVGLAAVTVVYTLVQVVVVGTLDFSAGTERPLATAARGFLGPEGAALIAAGALLSVYGYLSGQFVSAPRLTFALAEQGDFPVGLASIHSRFRTPHVSIVAYAVLVFGLAVAASFRWNAALSALARLLTYGLVCGSLLVLRRRQPHAHAFRLAGGTFFAVLGIAFCCVLVSRMGKVEMVVLLATATLASATWFWARRRTA